MASAAASARWWRASAAACLHPKYAAHQKGVPRLPIPTIEATCERYLRAAKPLQMPDQHDATVAAVKSFCAADGDGPVLQQALISVDASLPHESSYLESLWYRLAYLGPRSPVPIHSNPAFALAPPSEGEQPVARAAKLLAASARWAHALRTGALPAPTARGGAPLCMSMLPAVLGSSRLPEVGCDRLQSAPTSEHAAIYWRGDWFQLRLFGADGEPLPAPHLLASLERLPAASPASPARAIGAFTAWGRDQWAEARGLLLEHEPCNMSALSAMDDALLVLSLDDDTPDSPTALGLASLCGDATRRWCVYLPRAFQLACSAAATRCHALPRAATRCHALPRASLRIYTHAAPRLGAGAFTSTQVRQAPARRLW